MPDITIYYSSIDHFKETKRFKTVAGASEYARKRLGNHPERGSHYAVSDDGVGKIEWSGASFEELFPAPT